MTKDMSDHYMAPDHEAFKKSKRAQKLGLTGSMLEFYDFFIFTQAAAIVFPHVFFPDTNGSLAIISSLATFGVGYVARPIGAFVFGALGDRKGRRFTLIITMILMAVSTFAIGFLPSYDSVGIIAPILLVICRLVQGFAVAGEISNSSTLILEQSPLGMRGEAASRTLQGAQLGQIFAALIFIPLAAYLPEDDFQSWGWRIPFILSAILIIIASEARLKVTESEIMDTIDGEERKSAILEVFQNNLGTVTRVFFMALMNIIPVTATVFGASLATQEAYGVEWDPAVYLWIPVLGNLLAVLIIPRTGRLSDKIGRRPVMIGGAVSSGFLAIFYLWAIMERNIFFTVLVALLMWGTLYQGYNAVFPAYFPELFPAGTRATGVAIGQNFGTAVSSLMASFFAWICPPGTDELHIVLIVGGLTFFITILAAIAAWTSPETSRIPVEHLGEKDPVEIPEDEYLHMRELNIQARDADKRQTD